MNAFDRYRFEAPLFYSHDMNTDIYESASDCVNVEKKVPLT